MARTRTDEATAAELIAAAGRTPIADFRALAAFLNGAEQAAIRQRERWESLRRREQHAAIDRSARLAHQQAERRQAISRSAIESAARARGYSRRMQAQMIAWHRRPNDA